jgi:MSHA biogenesis protein MshI
VAINYFPEKTLEIAYGNCFGAEIPRFQLPYVKNSASLRVNLNIIKSLAREVHVRANLLTAGMKFFSKARKKSGSLALAFDAEGVCVARAARAGGAMPAVLLATHIASAAPRAPETLAKIAKDLRANLYQCNALLSAGEYQFLAVEAPAVPAEELKTAVRWRLKDMLDFSPDKATIDVLEIAADKAGTARANQIFAVAAHNPLIEKRQNLLVDAGWDLGVIDIPEMAQRNISAMLEPDGRGVALLSFNADGGLLTVTYKGELYLSRRIDVTLDQLRDPDHNRRNECYDKITLELQRSLDHFERQYSFISIAKLVLAPTAAGGLDEYLSSNLYTKVETLNLASVLDLSAVPELADASVQQKLFLAIGAALREEGVAP